jgi:hypothetical protein
MLEEEHQPRGVPEAWSQKIRDFLEDAVTIVA